MAKPFNQVMNVRGLRHLLPLVAQAHDGVGCGSDIGDRCPKEAAPKNGHDFFAINHKPRYKSRDTGARNGTFRSPRKTPNLPGDGSRTLPCLAREVPAPESIRAVQILWKMA